MVEMTVEGFHRIIRNGIVIRGAGWLELTSQGNRRNVVLRCYMADRDYGSSDHVRVVAYHEPQYAASYVGVFVAKIDDRFLANEINRWGIHGVNDRLGRPSWGCDTSDVTLLHGRSLSPGNPWALRWLDRVEYWASLALQANRSGQDNDMAYWLGEEEPMPVTVGFLRVFAKRLRAVIRIREEHLDNVITGLWQ